MLVVMTGLPGVGKSYLARALAARLGADVLDRDAVRDMVFPARDLDYSPEQNELSSQIVYKVAEYILGRNPHRILILDGRPFSQRVQVEEVEQLAQRCGHALRILHCWAPEEIVRARLEADLSISGNVAADRTMDKYWRIQAAFEPLAAPHLAVDTSQPLADMMELVLSYLGVGSRRSGAEDELSVGK
jgi:predicted kinase